jgi:hypothetical protein
MNQFPEAISPSFGPYQGPPSIGIHHTKNGFGVYSSSATHGDILWAEEAQHAVNLTYENVDEAGLTSDEATAAAKIAMDVVHAYCYREEPSKAGAQKIHPKLLATIESYAMGEESCIMALAKHVAFTFVNFLTTFGYSSELTEVSTRNHFLG